MKVPAELLALLRERTGLDPDILGAPLLERVWTRHKPALAELALGGQAWTAFLDDLVIPETWLFREEKSFDYLLRWLRDEWTQRHPQTHFHALSLPCATGEEAYSIAATALEAGLAADAIHVDACDISRRALAAGERGFYRGRSARLSRRRAAHRYFDDVDGGMRAGETLRRCVAFRAANILNAGGFGTRYPVVFCRNLLIYLTRDARAATLANLQRLLAPQGILFLGHADTVSGLDESFERLNVDGAFAYAHRGPPRKQLLCAQNRMPPVRPLTMPPRQASGKRKTRAAIPRENRRTPAEQFERAQALANKGAIQEAHNELKELLRTNPNAPEAWYLMGLLHSALGEASEAEACYERTLALEPGNSDAAMHLALLVDDRGGAPSSRRRK